MPGVSGSLLLGPLSGALGAGGFGHVELHLLAVRWGVARLVGIVIGTALGQLRSTGLPDKVPTSGQRCTLARYIPIHTL